MTRLEAHRRLLEEEHRHGPLLRIEDLNPDEIALINASFLELLRRRRPADVNGTYAAYVDTLHQWGVMCPHPQPHRRYDGTRVSEYPIAFETSRWYDCSLCGTSVVNR